MYWTVLCQTEKNPRYNAAQVIDLSNWKDFKMYRCPEQLKWNECDEPIPDLVEMLFASKYTTRFTSREQISSLIDRCRSGMSESKSMTESVTDRDQIHYEIKSPKQHLAMRVADVENISSEIQTKCLVEKLKGYQEIITACDVAEWYANRFWFVPILGARYKKQHNSLWAQKCLYEIDSMRYAQFMVDEFKTLVSQIDTNHNKPILIKM